MQEEPIGPGALERENRQPRIEPQYLQAATQFWANINTIIWQRLIYIAVIQSGSLYFAISHIHTWLSIFVTILAFTL